MKHEILAYDSIAPNDYNPNVMTERVYKAELESILTFGFIDPLTVRETADGILIIDGEHRWKAFGLLRQQWQDGEIPPFHPDLLPLFERNQLPVVNLGDIPDVDAKKLTIILNETRGKANTVDLAALLAQIAAETGGENLHMGLPYGEDELQDILKLAHYDWEAVANTPLTQNQHAENGEGEAEELELVSLRMSSAGQGVLMQVAQVLEIAWPANALPRHSDPQIALGQVVEHLAAHYLTSNSGQNA